MVPTVASLIASAIIDDAVPSNFTLGAELEVFVRCQDAERFIEEVRGDDPEAADKLMIEERELEGARLN